MEACCGAHHLGRLFANQGHDVQLMTPEYVQPYWKAQKNDDRDAERIAEATTPPTVRFVELKAQEQPDAPPQLLAPKPRQILRLAKAGEFGRQIGSEFELELDQPPAHKCAEIVAPDELLEWRIEILECLATQFSGERPPNVVSEITDVMGNGGIWPTIAVGIDWPAAAIGLHFPPKRLDLHVGPVGELIAKHRLVDVERPQGARQMVVVDDEDLFVRTDNVGDRLAVEIGFAVIGRQPDDLRGARGHFRHSERELGWPEIADRNLDSRHFLLLVTAPTGSF